jgi:hypothetical protein
MRVLGLVLLPLAAGQCAGPACPETPVYDAVPMEVRVPLDVGDCVRAVKSIDHEDLYGSPKIVHRHDKGTLVHVAPDHVVVKWNRQETLARAAAFPHQVRRAQWPKGTIASIADFTTTAESKDQKRAAPLKCMTVVEYHGFPPMIKPMDCVDNWQNQQFTTPLTCRPGQIYWKKDPTLCIDAVHPELVQLRDCNGLESQMFALAEPDGVVNHEVSDEGFLVGTGMTKDMCFKFVDKRLHFGACDDKDKTKFQFKDFPKEAE